LQQTFGNNIPTAQVLWISKALKPTVEKILQHQMGFLRVRYWQQDTTSVWILEEIGKTKPITIGVVVQAEKIADIKVLAFRESRGWEIKHEFFTNQFKGLYLTPDLHLNTPIDGISGATLSVRAMTKISQLALLFAQQLSISK